MGPDAPTPFPTGLVATKAHLYLSYGVADADWRIAQLDRAKLLASLVPVHTEAYALPQQVCNLDSYSRALTVYALSTHCLLSVYLLSTYCEYLLCTDRAHRAAGAPSLLLRDHSGRAREAAGAGGERPATKACPKAIAKAAKASAVVARGPGLLCPKGPSTSCYTPLRTKCTEALCRSLR